MPKTHILLLLCFILASCKGQKKTDLHIPDQVAVKPSSTVRQFPGTGVFITLPSGYKLVEDLGHFQKNDNTHVLAHEYYGESFSALKPAILKSIEIERDGRTENAIYYKKEFKLGAYDAVLVLEGDIQPNRENLVLLFGDDEFCAMLTSNIPVNNTATRDEVLKALLTTYEDKTARPDPVAMANYTLDVSGTEFKYVNYTGDTYWYSVGGKGDLRRDIFLDRITVEGMPNVSDSFLKELALNLVSANQETGVEISALHQQETRHKGNYAFEISYKCVTQGRTGTVYMLSTQNDKSSVLFEAYIYDRQEELMAQVKKIAATLTIK